MSEEIVQEDVRPIAGVERVFGKYDVSEVTCEDASRYIDLTTVGTPHTGRGTQIHGLENPSCLSLKDTQTN